MISNISRKATYKLPPTTITDKLVSQEARRSKALEEQKRKRAQRVDSSRQLDQFADLNLGVSDEEEDDDKLGGSIPDKETAISLASVAHYATMLGHEVTPSEIATHVVAPPSRILPQSQSSSKPHTQPPNQSHSHPHPHSESQTQMETSTKKLKKKRKGKGKGKGKPNKWADQCMYAELLEMATEYAWSSGETSQDNDIDGLPRDLETGWVAVGPVPVGKRCLAVTQQSTGVAGVVPNTTLRSRLLGKVLIHKFPSVLPPMTVLDCILDKGWRENGILHVLDVVKWKGQDISDCETSFRFWWRDTRLAELAQVAPPAVHVFAPNPPIGDGENNKTDTRQYQFPYPTTFVPVPYHTDTSLSTLYTQILPLARSVRSVAVQVPVVFPSLSPAQESEQEASMDVDASSFSFGTPRCMAHVEANVTPDGLLLYVAEASYEAGTSPLSSWIPICGYEEEAWDGHGEGGDAGKKGMGMGREGPLDLFQRLVHRRLVRRGYLSVGGEVVDMAMDV